MSTFLDDFWALRLNDCREALEANNFEAHVAADTAAAKALVLESILPELKPTCVSWGGSMTFPATGLYDELKDRTEFKVIDTYDKKLTREQIIELRREALLCDLFFTGTSAVTEAGQLVNLDMIGNRVAALTFGPRHVVVLVGRNKIVTDLDDAMWRIKNHAAPANAMRLQRKTGCLKTGRCIDCKSDERICNTWTIHEKSYPKGRIKVILIDQDLGL